MFFVLSKILDFLFSPLVWVFILLIYSFLTKIESKSKKLRIFGFTLLYICSNSFIIDECYRVWEPVNNDFEIKKNKIEGAIVLGGIGEVDLSLNKINFSRSADRLFQTLPLFHKGRIKHIIFTGGSGSIEFPEKKEALYVKKYLKSINFPDSALIVESESKNTYENALFTKKIIDSLNLNGSFILVTSAIHMPRAMAVFKKVGFKNLIPFTTNKVSGIRRYTFDHLFIPNSSAISNLNSLIHEWIGYITYKIKGYA